MRISSAPSARPPTANKALINRPRSSVVAWVGVALASMSRSPASRPPSRSPSARSQTILDNLPIGLSLNNIQEGNVTFMNKKFQEIYGWTSDEITSVTTFFEKVYPNVTYRNELIDRIMSDIQSGDPEKMHWEDIVVTQKYGTQRIIDAANIPLIEQNTMVSTVVDITERKQAEVALKASEDRYRSFISQVSEGVYRFECDQPMDLNLPLEEQVDFIYDH